MKIDGKLTTYTIKQKSQIISYNFIKRDISHELQWLEEGKYFDIITPFDYGGYYSTCKELYPDFFEAFSKFCQEENIVSEFIRFCPTYDFDFETIGHYIDLQKVNDLIYIDLTGDFWTSYSRGRKSNINKIMNYNYSIESIHIDDFYTLYKDTMNRNNAHSFFIFNLEGLSNLAMDGFARLYGIYLDNELVSGLMLLDEKDISYYFLGATSSNLLSTHANALLFHKVALMLQKEGKKIFFLGGGRKGVYDFKRRFSNKTLPYYIGKKIHNQEVYNHLVNLTNSQENDFFPKYREKVI